MPAILNVQLLKRKNKTKLQWLEINFIICFSCFKLSIGLLAECCFITFLAIFYMFKKFQVRLCIFWRSNMIVSRPIRQSIVGAGGRARAPKLIAQLQISLNSYVICWSSPLPRVYKVSLYLLDGTLVSSAETTDSCYLFKSIPTENCCRANIGYASINEASLDVAVKLELTTTNGNIWNLLCLLDLILSRLRLKYLLIFRCRHFY